MTKRRIEVFEDRLLVLSGSGEDVERVQSSLPKTWLLPDPGEVAMPWDFENAAWLTAVGYPSVSPILRDYDWPCPPDWNVMSHQYRIADFCVRNRRGYVLAGTGTGKTASVIWAVDYLMRLGYVRRVLVLCPLSVISDAWLPTVSKLLIGRTRVHALVGDHAKRSKIAQDNAAWHIVNFDGLGAKGLFEILLANDYDCVVVDESTAIKNRNTERWKLVYPLVRKAAWAWQLTGTPTPQGPKDAYGQLCLFDRFGAKRITMTRWEDLTTFAVSKYRRIPRKDWQKIVANYMRPAIKVNTRDCVDLPPITYTARKVPLTKPQAAAIKALSTDKVVKLGGVQVSADNQAILLNKLCQICAGAVYDENGDIVEVKASGRLAEVEYLFEQAEGKVIVYAPFRGAVQMIAEHLRKKDFKVGIVHGGISATARQKVFDAFQREDKSELDGLIAVPSAMAHGVTLTRASVVCWYAPVDKTETYLQANARMERKGQKQHMTVVELWGHPRERELYSVLAGRTQGMLSLLDIYQKIAKGVIEDSDD